MEYLQKQLTGASVDALRNTACIATFSSSRFGDDTKDGELASELASSHGASSAAFNVTKKLFGGSYPELEACEQHVRATYTKHRKLTKPWKKRGGGLLPNASIPEYLGMMGEASQKLDSLKELLRATLDTAHNRAKLRLGTAYKESDYMNLHAIPDRYEIHFELEPIPDSDDLKMPEGFEQVQLAGLAAGIRARFARAIATDWSNIKAALDAAIAKSEDTAEAKRWHDSTRSAALTGAEKLIGFISDIGCFDEANDNETRAMLDTLRGVVITLESHDIKRIASMESERKRFNQDCKRLRNAMGTLHLPLTSSTVNTVDTVNPDDTSSTDAEPVGTIEGALQVVDILATAAAIEEAEEAAEIEAFYAEEIDTPDTMSTPTDLDGEAFHSNFLAAGYEYPRAVVREVQISEAVTIPDEEQVQQEDQVQEQEQQAVANPVASLPANASIDDIVNALLG